jgi:hypothetical protein
VVNPKKKGNEYMVHQNATILTMSMHIKKRNSNASAFSFLFILESRNHHALALCEYTKMVGHFYVEKWRKHV